MRLNYNIIDINYKVICKINNNTFSCVNILMFKNSASWLSDQTIFSNKIEKRYFIL